MKHFEDVDENTCKIKMQFSSTNEVNGKIEEYYNYLSSALTEVASPMLPQKMWSKKEEGQLTLICIQMFAKFEFILKFAVKNLIDYNEKLDENFKKLLIKTLTSLTVIYPNNLAQFLVKNLFIPGIARINFDSRNEKIKKMIDFNSINIVRSEMRNEACHGWGITKWSVGSMWMCLISLTNLLINIDICLCEEVLEKNDDSIQEVCFNKNHYPEIVNMEVFDK